MLQAANQGRRLRDEPDHNPRRQGWHGPDDDGAKRGQGRPREAYRPGASAPSARPRPRAGWVELPWALARKYPNAGREWAWQWVFPATRFYVDPATVSAAV